MLVVVGRLGYVGVSGGWGMLVLVGAVVCWC